MDIKRIAQLVRMLSSHHPNELLMIIHKLTEIVNFNDLGNLIEFGPNGKDSGDTNTDGRKLSREEMKTVYRNGFDDGYKEGREQGIIEGKKMFHRDGFADIHDNSLDQIKVEFCQKHKDKLQKKREKEFVDNVANWTMIRHKPLTESQNRWLDDIYDRLKRMGLS